MKLSTVCALLLAVIFGLTVFGQTGRTASGQDSQHGETVVAHNQGGLDAPVRRHPKALWYELDNLRKETGRPSIFGGEIALDFRRDVGSSGWQEVVMVVKSKNGRREFRSIGISPFAKDQGTVQGRTYFGPFDDRLGDTLEVWLEQQQNIGGKQVRMKVSKSITLGNVGQLTYAREWTPEEAKAFGDWEKSTTPPPAPPAGYVLVGPGTAILPGMPVLAGWMAAWQPAEVIDLRSDTAVLVKYRDVSSHLTARPRNWVAVESKTLEAGRTNPAQFRASVRVLPGGSTPVPADLVPIEAETPLVKGAPLKAEWAGRWNDVTVIELKEGGKVRIHWDNYGSNWDEDRERTTLLMTPATLAALKKPDAAEQFAKKAEKLETGAFGKPGAFGGVGDPFAGRRHLHHYPIRLTIPKTAERVTDETPLEEGTKLGCCWGTTWHNVTVLEVHDDKAVKIRWDAFGSVWDCDIARECLIIDKKVLAKLTSKAKTPSALKPANTGDSAGGDRFKVVLKGAGTAKIAVTKVLMEATGLDLKDAKDYVESVPVTLKQNLTKEAAEKLRQELQGAGGTAAIELQ